MMYKAINKELAPAWFFSNKDLSYQKERKQIHSQFIELKNSCLSYEKHIKNLNHAYLEFENFGSKGVAAKIATLSKSSKSLLKLISQVLERIFSSVFTSKLELNKIEENIKENKVFAKLQIAEIEERRDSIALLLEEFQRAKDADKKISNAFTQVGTRKVGLLKENLFLSELNINKQVVKELLSSSKPLVEGVDKRGCPFYAVQRKDGLLELFYKSKAMGTTWLASLSTKKLPNTEVYINEKGEAQDVCRSLRSRLKRPEIIQQRSSKSSSLETFIRLLGF